MTCASFAIGQLQDAKLGLNIGGLGAWYDGHLALKSSLAPDSAVMPFWEALCLVIGDGVKAHEGSTGVWAAWLGLWCWGQREGKRLAQFLRLACPFWPP